LVVSGAGVLSRLSRGGLAELIFDWWSGRGRVAVYIDAGAELKLVRLLLERLEKSSSRPALAI
jgi:hypothetical protein